MQFDKHFQKHFAAHILRDGVFVERVWKDLQVDIFADDNLRRVVKIAVDFFRDNKSAPGVLIYQQLDSWLSSGLISSDHHTACTAIVDDLFVVQLQNRQYLLNEFDRFLRHQMFVSRAPEITDAFRTGRTDHAEHLFKQIFSFRSSKDVNLGVAYTASTSDRISRRENEDTSRVWTLIPELDAEIDGLRIGEMGVLLSQRTSGGKSAGLVFLARSLAMQGKKVLIFPLEMTEAQYEDRLDQAVAGLHRRDLKDATVIQQRVSKLLSHGGGIRVCALPAYRTRVSTLIERTEMIRQIHGFHPDVILIDYADLLAPETDKLRGDLHAVGAEVYSELLGWIQSEELILWTAAQSGRNTTEAAHATAEDVAGSIAKMQIAQLVISLNRTPEEEANNIFRLYVAKNRDGRARFSVPIKSDLSRMLFWVPDQFAE